MPGDVDGKPVCHIFVGGIPQIVPRMSIGRIEMQQVNIGWHRYLAYQLPVPKSDMACLLIGPLHEFEEFGPRFRLFLKRAK